MAEVKHSYIPLDTFFKLCAAKDEFLPKMAVPEAANLPRAFSLRQYCPSAYDQGQLGACTGNCIAGVIKITTDPQKKGLVNPSRNWIYTQELKCAGQTAPYKDTGANAADGCAVINSLGVCDEEFMPYTIDETGKVTSFGDEPSADAYANAALHKYQMYSTVARQMITPRTIKQYIYANTPVMMAFLVFRNLEAPGVSLTGKMGMPTHADLHEGPIGGHEVAIVGWDEDRDEFEIFNSWGPNWGDKGFLWMPEEYIMHLYRGSPFVPQLLVLQPIQFQQESMESTY